MGFLYLLISKLSAIGKMIAMKNCGKLASGAKNSLKINLIRSLGCVAVSLVMCIFAGFSEMSGAGIGISVLSGISNAALLFLWVLCAERCSLCSVEIFCMIGGVALPLLVTPLLFGGETIFLSQWLGALLLFPAAYCFSLKSKSESSKLSPVSILFLLGACLSNAGCVISQKLFTHYNSGSAADFNMLTFIFCSATLGIALLLFSLKKSADKPDTRLDLSHRKHIIVYIIIAIVMLYLAQYFSTLSSGELPSAYFFPLSYAIGMPLTLLTDVIVFKEKIKISSIIGILSVIGAVILISLKF